VEVVRQSMTFYTSVNYISLLPSLNTISDEGFSISKPTERVKLLLPEVR
jgi:hypothetical protein